MSPTRWIVIHRGPRAETELLAMLLEAVLDHVRTETRLGEVELQVPLRDAECAEAWLEQAFEEVWARPERARFYWLGH